MDEAKANKTWFYALIAFLCLVVLVCSFVKVPDVASNAISIGLLCFWYASLGLKQIKYVKETLGDNYERKSWTKPLLIALGCLIGYFVFAVVVMVTVRRALHAK